MRGTARQQQDVTGAHGQALPIGKLDAAFAGQHDVIGRYAQGLLPVIQGPIALELTAQVQAAAHVGQADEFIDRIHLSVSPKNLSALSKPEGRRGEKLRASKQYTQPTQELMPCSITGPNCCPPFRKLLARWAAATRKWSRPIWR
ncbi:hypothetical protein D3C84_920890 [compost metagenome]